MANFSKHQLPPNNLESRAELKARMSKTQFSFGNKAQENRQMESMYTSGIDAQAKVGGLPSDGKKVRQELKQTNVMIGSKTISTVGQSEAASQFYARSKSSNSKTGLDRNASLIQKLKGQNFTLQEQKQGGQVNNYFQTSNKQSFGEIANPNQIRSKIPDGQLADNRAQHYYLGFDKSSFTARGVKNSFRKDSVSRNNQNKSLNTTVA